MPHSTVQTRESSALAAVNRRPGRGAAARLHVHRGLRSGRWLVLPHLVLFGGIAVAFRDWPMLTGVLVVSGALLMAWVAGVVSWGLTERWRRHWVGRLASLLLAAAVWLTLVGALASWLRPFYRGRVPYLPAPWPVTTLLALGVGFLLLWSFKRDRAA